LAQVVNSIIWYASQPAKHAALEFISEHNPKPAVLWWLQAISQC